MRTFLLGLALVLSPAASAGEIEGVSFPDRYTVRGVDLELIGTGLLRYRYFIKAYVAALYGGKDVGPETVLDDVPKRLEIEYFWAIGAKDFAKSTHYGIEANVDDETYEKLQPQIEQINELYRDVQPGDRYSLTYLPGVGTELALSGETLGRVEGAEFAAAMFSIWLGPSPINASLKKQLLGSR